MSRLHPSLCVLSLLVGCLPAPQSVGGDGSEGAPDDTSDSGLPTTARPGSDDLEGTGADLPTTSSGDTSPVAGDSDETTTGGDDPGLTSTGDPSTTTIDPSTSDGEDPSTGGSDSATTEATGSADVACEEMLDKISCDALADSPTILNAIGLGCEGDPLETIPIGPWTFPPATDPESWGIATQFGTHLDMMGEPTWGPREGETFLVLSSGGGVDPDEDGLLTFDEQDTDPNGNPDNSPLPAPVNWPVPVSANDLVWFQVELDVPAGVTGFSIDMAFFSEEFPENVGTTFNDSLVIWAETGVGAFETCATASGDPTCTVTGLWPTAYQGFDIEFNATGFSNDGATGWRTVRGPTAPNDTLQLTIAVFDLGDTTLNTLVLLDAFTWECDGCDGTPGNECGLQL